MKRFLLLLQSIFLFSFFLVGQNSPWLQSLEKALEEKETALAEKLLEEQTSHYWEEQNFDSLSYYPPFVGRVALLSKDADGAADDCLAFVRRLESSTKEPSILRQSWLESSSFFEIVGKTSEAFEQNKTALSYTEKWKESTGEDFGLVYANMGTYSTRLGDLTSASEYYHEALRQYLSYPDTKKESLQIIYNSLGGSMWYASKLDSAQYFYNKALETLEEMEDTPRNLYYRPAILNNNIAAILSMEGRPTESIEAMKSCIQDLEKYIPTIESGIQKQKAQEFMYQAIDNLASIYKDLGNYKKSYDLIQFSARQKKENLPPDSPEQFKSLVLLGQSELYLRDYDIAAQHLDSAIAFIERIPGRFIYWYADAHQHRAEVFKSQKNYEKAEAYYEKCEALLEEAFQGEYDEIVLGFMIEASTFYAQQGKREKALATARKGYDFAKRRLGEESLMTFQLSWNLADIHYLLGDYEEALDLSEESLKIIEGKNIQPASFLDSVQVEYRLPALLLLKSKTRYVLTQKKDLKFLKSILKDLDRGLDILDRRKAFVASEDDIRVLMINNQDFYEFYKQVAYDYFLQSKDQNYIDLLINLHEISLYSRIRERLSENKDIQFAGIPNSVIEQEKEIKGRLDQYIEASALNESDQNRPFSSFVSLSKEWEEYLKMLQKEYPKYYEVRFGTQYATLLDIQENLPPATTAVRYFFIEDQLFVMILSRDLRRLYKLEYNSEDQLIAELSNFPSDPDKVGEIMHKLYQQLWAPFEDEILNEKVVIIPDRELFNLSFDLLTKEPIQNFSELAENCLLSQYALSYNFSLFLVKESEEHAQFNENYIAFAPGFSDEMKESYLNRIQDSLSLDQGYLRMLPQPFILDLTKLMRKSAGGKAFLLEESTKSTFRNQANGHKIIHIGTHAESDNLNPELSRLVFAKNMQGKELTDDNYLHAYEIYSYNLNSHLALLTACETGKPAYQAGEGMISMAHAFNYAGSESILTALWKIDEKSSAEITELFYQEILAGTDKDLALRKAKLTYIEKASGRTLAPEYWAGLVIMGDSSAIEIEENRPNWYWFLGFFLLAALLLMLIRFIRK
ncbi:MAG: CHAT domain-containing tetratricopeptide repeat protein [Bacteroidia bacterium]|nr:CHAT domain-containing tetratricopeptide repeat protein [Bacteroidia bacterium]